MTNANQTRYRVLLIDDTASIHDDIKTVLCAGGSPLDIAATNAMHSMEALLFDAESTLLPDLAPAFDIDSTFQGQDGYRVLCDALVRGEPYALAIVDMRMPPGWNGLETVAKLWEVDSELQVVICTAFSDHGWTDIAKQLGYSDRLLVIKKPFDSIEILQASHALCRKWQLQREVGQKLIMLDGLVAARTAELHATNAELQRAVTELWSEMDLARKIQTLLLPQNPQLPSYEVAANMVPASSVGGDYYDVCSSDGVDWILIGDVAGHGVTAGLIMMIVQTAVRAIIQSAADHASRLTPRQLLSRVNAAVRDNLQRIDAQQYMTIMALRLEGQSASYSGLHQDILVYRAQSKAVERIETRGVWIGVLDEISDLLEDDRFEMADGDLLLLYTDGVTEFRAGGHMLGTEGLAAILEELARGCSVPTGVVKGIIDRVCITPLNDDVTVLAARYARGTPPCKRL